jgi:hypothetical protein
MARTQNTTEDRRRTVGHVPHEALVRVDRRVKEILARREPALPRARQAAERLKVSSDSASRGTSFASAPNGNSDESLPAAPRGSRALCRPSFGRAHRGPRRLTSGTGRRQAGLTTRAWNAAHAPAVAGVSRSSLRFAALGAAAIAEFVASGLGQRTAVLGPKRRSRRRNSVLASVSSPVEKPAEVRAASLKLPYQRPRRRPRALAASLPANAQFSAGVDHDWGPLVHRPSEGRSASGPRLGSELGAQRIRPESWLQPSGPIPERDCTAPLLSVAARPCRVRRTSTRQQPASPGVAAGRFSPLGRSKRFLSTGFDGDEQRGPLSDG